MCYLMSIFFTEEIKFLQKGLPPTVFIGMSRWINILTTFSSGSLVHPPGLFRQNCFYYCRCGWRSWYLMPCPLGTTDLFLRQAPWQGPWPCGTGATVPWTGPDDLAFKFWFLAEILLPSPLSTQLYSRGSARLSFQITATIQRYFAWKILLSSWPSTPPFSRGVTRISFQISVTKYL